MALHDVVLELMSSDPKAEWTAPQIAKTIFPDAKTMNDRENKRKHVFNVLTSAEKYGFVEKTRVENHQLTYWRLIV